ERIRVQKAYMEKLSGYFRRLYGECADSIPILHHWRVQLLYRIELERVWQGLRDTAAEDVNDLVRELDKIERAASDCSMAGADLKALAAREAAFVQSLYGLILRSSAVTSLNE